MPVAPLLAALAFLLPVAPQSPGRIRVFTFSRDSLAGFSDERLDTFRRALGDHTSEFAEIAYTLESAHVGVQFLGRGELSIELGRPGEAVRYHWSADPKAPLVWALVRSGDFSKEFSVEGAGARDTSRLAKDIATWLRANGTVLREKHPRP